MTLNSLLTFTLSTLVPLAFSSTNNLPPDGQIWLGAWTQPQSGFDEFPVTINDRISDIGKLSMFQLSQTIPVTTYSTVTGAGGPVNVTELEETLSDAILFLTVYPTLGSYGWDAISEDDYTDLGNQILSYQQSLNRTVFLRYAPEMDGNWFIYGMQPANFLASWNQMYTIVKGIAPDVSIVWSPNIADGYPYGADLPSNATEAALLDTNGDGNLTEADNAYSPYYPGIDYVDWHGVSIYYKGPDFENENAVQPSGMCTKTLEGIDPWTSAAFTPFYDTYCNDTAKPCIFSESGAAYHVNISSGASQEAIQTGWVNDCMLNVTYLTSEHPNLRGIIMFEQAKEEYDGDVADYRDYRITNATASLDSFKSILTSNADLVAFASTRAANPNYTEFLSPFINCTTDCPVIGNVSSTSTNSTGSGTGSGTGSDKSSGTMVLKVSTEIALGLLGFAVVAVWGF